MLQSGLDIFSVEKKKKRVEKNPKKVYLPR